MYQGINDKFAIVSKDAIETYLTKPLEVYKNYHYNYRTRIKNPEQFLKHVYTYYGVTLLTYNININIMGHDAASDGKDTKRQVKDAVISNPNLLRLQYTCRGRPQGTRPWSP